MGLNEDLSASANIRMFLCVAVEVRNVNEKIYTVILPDVGLLEDKNLLCAKVKKSL